MASPAVTSPRDDVLSNEDLLGIIFDYVLSGNIGTSPTNNSTSNSNSYSPRTQLFRLAVTQRAFLQPALNALWSTIDSWIPLLKLLPAFVMVNNVYVINGPIESSDWEKLMSYAGRVKAITLGKQRQKVCRFVYHTLSVYLGAKKGRQPFRSLKSITVECTAENDYSFAFLAIRPALERVRICGVGSSSQEDVQFLQQFLLSLSHQAKDLKELVIHGRADESVAPALCHIPTFKAVSRLAINLSSVAIPLTVLEGLKALDCLSSLSLFVGSGSTTHPSLPVRPTNNRVSLPACFPSLKELKLHGTSYGISRALPMITLSAVRAIELRITGIEQTDSQLWRDCFHHISKGSRDLRSIKAVYTSTSNGAGSCNFSLKIIAPLFDITSLEHLHLDVSTLLGGNELISTISHSFPNLQTLILPSNPASTNPDLGCLAFLTACKKLEDVRLCLRLQRVDWEVTSKIQASHSLRHMHISDAGGEQSFGFKDCLSIAELLDRIFPDLMTLKKYINSRGQGRGKEQTLQDIEASLHAVQAARKRGYESGARERRCEGKSADI